MRHFLTCFFVLLTLQLIGQTNSKLSEVLTALDQLDSEYAVDNSVWEGQHPESFNFPTFEEKVKKERSPGVATPSA